MVSLHAKSQYSHLTESGTCASKGYLHLNEPLRLQCPLRERSLTSTCRIIHKIMIPANCEIFTNDYKAIWNCAPYQKAGYQPLSGRL